MDEVEDDVERASEDEGKEQAESCQVRVSLRATRVMVRTRHATQGDRNVLELARGHVGLCADVLCPCSRRLGEVGLCGHSPHPLHGIDE